MQHIFFFCLNVKLKNVNKSLLNKMWLLFNMSGFTGKKKKLNLKIG